MSYQSNLGPIQARIRAARDAGLRAAATVGINNTKLRLDPAYYTGGKYKTGALLASITRTEPFDVPGGRAIKYGTDLKYAIYWELGFNQRLIVWKDEKTGRWYSKPGPTRFVRKEIWMPVFTESAEQMRTAYATTFKRFFEAGA